jgi:hypothetical protein
LRSQAALGAFAARVPNNEGQKPNGNNEFRKIASDILDIPEFLKARQPR